MESASRSATFPPSLLARDWRSHSAWTRTVAVIRIPRFPLLESIRGKRGEPDDPLAAFATETELESSRRARSRP
ncbi:MAG: hypothetical protein ACRD26_00185 [Vicinamibacterales bacterium]